MPDIRKMLEKQLEILQGNSEMMSEGNAPSENTYAMLAIIEVLYPEGIRAASAVDNLVASREIDTESVVSKIADMMSKQRSTLTQMAESLETRIEG